MDLETFHWLLGPQGQDLLHQTMAADLGDAQRLAQIERLRRVVSSAQAAAVYETALLRQRATSKFPHAERLYFTRDALEQASGMTIANYRAQRFAGYGRVADLCCSVGGDSLALAQQCLVSAVDRDPVRLAMAEANAQALGLADRIEHLELDLELQAPPAADAIFFDPARRSSGKRMFAVADYQPSLDLIHEWRKQTPAIGIKAAPGVQDDELAPYGVDELEFISVDGNLKESVLWFGPLAQAGQRATLLSSEPDSPVHSLFLPRGQEQAIPDLREPAAYLYEPDPAVIRAQLVASLADLLGAAQIDRTIAYLTSDTATANPFARCWRINEWMPFNLKRLRARLHQLDVGAVTVKKRGSPLDTDTLAKQLSGKGSRSLVIVLTQCQNRPIALICEGPIAL
jgi:hypothetical protein